MKRALLLVTLTLLPGLARAENGDSPFAAEGDFNKPIQYTHGQQEKAAGVSVPGGIVTAPAASGGGNGGGANPANDQKALTPPAAPAKKDDKKKDDKKQPEMPPLPGLPGGKKPGANQNGGSNSSPSAAGSKLDEAARQLLLSKDKDKAALGRRVDALSKSRKAALESLDKANTAMRTAKKDLEEANEAFRKFASEEQNGKDVKNIKEVAKDELASGKQALDCPRTGVPDANSKEPPSPVPPIAGDPSRKAKYPPDADAKVAEASRLLEDAEVEIKAARKTVEAMHAAGKGIVETDAQLRSHLNGGVNRQFALTITDAVGEVEAKTTQAEARLKELQVALKASKEEAQKTAHDADTKTEEASSKAAAAKAVITAQNQNLDTAAMNYAPFALPPPLGPGLTGMANPGCVQAKPANAAIKEAVDAAQIPVPPAEQAVEPAVKAAAKAKETLDKVGRI